MWHLLAKDIIKPFMPSRKISNGQAFLDATILKRHVDRVHATWPKKFQRDLCPNSFVLNYALKCHKQKIHEKKIVEGGSFIITNIWLTSKLFIRVKKTSNAIYVKSNLWGLATWKVISIQLIKYRKVYYYIFKSWFLFKVRQ